MKNISTTSALPGDTGTITSMKIKTHMKREKGQNMSNFINKDLFDEHSPLQNHRRRGGRGGGGNDWKAQKHANTKKNVLTPIPQFITHLDLSKPEAFWPNSHSLIYGGTWPF